MEAQELAGWSLILGATLLVGLAYREIVVHGPGWGSPFTPPRQLVLSGPFRLVRNPIYLASCASLVGGILLVSWPEGLVLALAYFLLLHLWVTRYEEPRLERKFGNRYTQYRRAVPRWLPRLPGK